MNVMHTILDTDKTIIENTEIDTTLYGMVERFVKEHNLDQRKIGSKLFFWLDVKCEGERSLGYYFELNIRDNLVERIIRLIKERFTNELETIIKQGCTLELRQ